MAFQLSTDNTMQYKSDKMTELDHFYIFIGQIQFGLPVLTRARHPMPDV